MLVNRGRLNIGRPNRLDLNTKAKQIVWTHRNAIEYGISFGFVIPFEDADVLVDLRFDWNDIVITN